MTAVRDAVRSVSPRHRRYERLLASCTLDPAALTRPVPEPSTHDVILCGCPRSGTALLTAALHQPPTMVTVMEPWDGLRVPPAELFASLRHELMSGRLGRGRLDLDTLERCGRVVWLPEAHTSFAVTARADTLVGVKWPTFWQYLPLLPTTRFVVCVRHPADVIASFAEQPGQLQQGFEYDVAFNRSLNDHLAPIASTAERRLALYDDVYRTVLDHAHQPNVHLVRYEDWHRDPADVLVDLSHFLGRDLTDSRARITVPEPTIDPGIRGAIADRSRTARALGY